MSNATLNSAPLPSSSESAEYEYVFGVRGTRYRKDRAERGTIVSPLTEQPKPTVVPFDASLPTTCLHSGVAYLLSGDVQLAITEFTKAIELDPDFAAAFANRGTAMNMIDRFDAAISDFDKALKLDPGNTGALFGRGIACMNLKDYHAAVFAFSACVIYEPLNPECYIQRALSFFQLDEYSDANSDIDNALRLAPFCVEANFCKGSIMAAMGQFKLALHYWSYTIELDDHYAPAFLTRGALLKSLGHPQWLADHNRAQELDSSLTL